MEHNKIENDDDDTGARKLQRPYLFSIFWSSRCG